MMCILQLIHCVTFVQLPNGSKDLQNPKPVSVLIILSRQGKEQGPSSQALWQAFHACAGKQRDKEMWHCIKISLPLCFETSKAESVFRFFILDALAVELYSVIFLYFFCPKSSFYSAFPLFHSFERLSV